MLLAIDLSTGADYHIDIISEIYDGIPAGHPAESDKGQNVRTDASM